MSRHSRRGFLKGSVAAAGATFAISGTKASGKVLGANERIRVGVAGINGRGGSHIREFGRMENVEVSYLIDPDSRLFDSRIKRVEQSGGNRPTAMQDIRQALEDKNLDAISIAAPNHWHALLTIWACQAGKDVYVEKPASHNIHEGRIALDTARRHGRIVQHGTQQRSSSRRHNEIAAVHSGKYGKLLVSKGYCCKPRWSIGYKPFKSPPKELAFDLWLGPAPQQPYHENLVHYNWHWFWDTGNGDIGNQGVHEMDVARWAIKGATLPKRVISMGGRFGYDDQGETANTQMAIMEFDDAHLVFETRGLVGGKNRIPRKVANEYYTTEGMITNGRFHPKGGGKAVKLDTFETHLGPGRGNFGNFIAAVRSRKKEDLNADIREGHFSAALCHLPNISMRFGELKTFDSCGTACEAICGDNEVVAQTAANIEKNLHDNGIELKGLPMRVGKLLELDAKTERFTNEPEANKLMTRPYRAPYTVPARVV